MPATKPYKKPNLMDKVGKDSKLTLSMVTCASSVVHLATRSMSTGRGRPLMPPRTTSPRLARLMPLFCNPPIRVQKNSK
jgi:hypothetical protein